MHVRCQRVTRNEVSNFIEKRIFHKYLCEDFRKFSEKTLKNIFENLLLKVCCKYILKSKPKVKSQM